MPILTTWKKSSYCGTGDSCVHIAASGGTIHLTESADPHGVILDARPPAFSALLAVLKKESPRV
ncbi:DUF397 domain-containing protein [Streptomyces sp. NL15-2K]|uniref:DUF397 domain-containing protein n=1 Tax=Streptomyces sp. NL15-2K TaxID=376149 RepID=UPI000FF988AA|nr:MULTISPECIES: DUF397 domain-containing protein [Actinomycetes]WKX10461.1 DUF397 domain-containing protein [Kutzneria buriramensis]GCB48009.1 hypothetical protein SNL152K_5332 [Streptomyces sp. NL15-2K]